MLLELLSMILGTAPFEDEKKNEYKSKRKQEYDLYEMMMDLDEDELEEYKDNDCYDEDDY